MGGTRFSSPAVCLVGVSHDTAPLQVRERLSIPRSRVPDALQALRDYVPSGVILATCNRTEVYAVGDDGRALQDSLEGFLVDWSGVAKKQLSPRFHIAFEYDAIRHVTETASGLRSMIVGEWEIQGQVRQALEEAERAQMVDLPLRKLFQHAIRVGRRVRADTDISKNALSVSSVAVALASKAAGDIKNCRVLLIGAGQAGSARTGKDGAGSPPEINMSMMAATWRIFRSRTASGPPPSPVRRYQLWRAMGACSSRDSGLSGFGPMLQMTQRTGESLGLE